MLILGAIFVGYGNKSIRKFKAILSDDVRRPQITSEKWRDA